MDKRNRGIPQDYESLSHFFTDAMKDDQQFDYDAMDDETKNEVDGFFRSIIC